MPGQRVQRTLRVGGRAEMAAPPRAVLNGLGEIGEGQHHVVGRDVGQTERPHAGSVDDPPRFR